MWCVCVSRVLDYVSFYSFIYALLSTYVRYAYKYCWILWLALSTPVIVCLWPLECVKMLFIRVCKYRQHHMISLNLIEKFSEIRFYISFDFMFVCFSSFLPDNCTGKKNKFNHIIWYLMLLTVFPPSSARTTYVYMISLNTWLTIFIND